MAISTEIEAVVLDVLDRHECDLVFATFRREKPGYVLRVLIERRGADPDKGSGVDLGLCSTINRDIGTAIDVSEAIDRAYTLEVSSPGIERPLVRPEDYERFVGRPIALKTERAIDGKRRFKGKLTGFDNGQVILSYGKGRTVSVPFENVKKANLVFEPKGFGANAGER